MLRRHKCDILVDVSFSSALSHFFHSIQLSGDDSNVLRHLINPMDSQQSFSFSYGYLPIMKQCANPLYFLHFTQYYLTLVLSLPEQFHPNWIVRFIYCFYIETIHKSWIRMGERRKLWSETIERSSYSFSAFSFPFIASLFNSI